MWVDTDNQIYFTVKEIADLFDKTPQWVRLQEKSLHLTFKRRDTGNKDRMVSTNNALFMITTLWMNSKITTEKYEELSKYVERFEK